jgi:hypothetical protein
MKQKGEDGESWTLTKTKRTQKKLIAQAIAAP